MTPIEEQIGGLDQTTLEAAEGVEAPVAPTALKPQRKRGKIAFWLACGWLFLVFFGAIFADLLPLHPYDAIVDGLDARTPPRLSIHEPLGTDSIGRSMTSRIVYG